MFKRLRWKIAGIFILIITVSMLLLSGYLLHVFESNRVEYLQSSLRTQANIASRLLMEQEDLYEEEVLNKLAGEISKDCDARVTIILAREYVTADSENENVTKTYILRPEVSEAFEKGNGMAIRASSKTGAEMVHVATTFSENGEPTGVVRLSAPVNRNEVLWLWFFVFIIIIITLLIVLFASHRLSMQLNQPVDQLIKFARRFSRGEFEYRAPVTSNDEIGELASTLNKMAATIEEKVRMISEGKNTLETVLSNMISGVLFINNDGKLELANPAAERFLTFANSNDRTGLPYDVLLKNPDLSAAIHKALEKGEFVEEEIRTRVGNSDIEVIISPIHDNEGYLAGVVVVLHDITQIRKLARMRKEFVANVSHELRTPVTSIKGFTETLLDGALYDHETCKDFVKIIDKEAERLKRLIQDLLELSKIESKQVELKCSKEDISKVARNAIIRFKDKINSYGIKLRESYPEKPVFAEVDSNLIEQVMVNLLDNAIMYNRVEGSIEVEVKEEKDYVVVWVSDTGIGINREDIERIFERFYRVEKGRSRELGGTGLGLSIVKHIIEAHGGTVGVNSRPGQGSEFFLTLPKKQKKTGE